jgi:hypothetical protein
MAWVRYDDQFPSNPKVTAVIAEDPGALALHVLANTWTNAQKTPGFIPVHQPAILLCDRGLAAKWASVLVHARLWHERGQECDECAEEYRDLPVDAAGYVVHNAKQYRPPARERQTPGTTEDISAKRQAAGSKGGKATAAQRTQQTARANAAAKAANGPAKAANGDEDEGGGWAPSPESDAADLVDGSGLAESDMFGRTEQPARAKAANGASKSSKPSSKSASPVPVPVPDIATDVATTSQPSAGGEINAGTLLAGWIDYCRARNVELPQRLIGHYAREIKNALGDKFTPNQIKNALARMFEDNETSRPSGLPNKLVEIQTGPRRWPRTQPTDNRLRGQDTRAEGASDYDNPELMRFK